MIVVVLQMQCVISVCVCVCACAWLCACGGRGSPIPAALEEHTCISFHYSSHHHKACSTQQSSARLFHHIGSYSLGPWGFLVLSRLIFSCLLIFCLPWLYLLVSAATFALPSVFHIITCSTQPPLSGLHFPSSRPASCSLPPTACFPVPQINYLILHPCLGL